MIILYEKVLRVIVHCNVSSLPKTDAKVLRYASTHPYLYFTS